MTFAYKTSGPLQGVRVIEFAGIGPGPFAAMLLSDMGADVLRIDRAGAVNGERDVLLRGRSSLAFDLKRPEDLAACRALVGKADILLEGFRPGVMERLGLGPQEALKLKPSLVYGRMTGWGQSGRLAQAAGHDINYIAVTGALACLGPPDRPPPPPLNLLGDFGGGSLYLAMGVLAALLHARETGIGQVVDAAIVDGAASLMAMAYSLQAMGEGARESNMLDGGAPFYRCYACADGDYIAIGPLEARFYGELLDRLGVASDHPLRSQDPNSWADNRARLEAIFRTRTRAEWTALLEGTDACFAPVLDRREAPQHPHMRDREVFVEAFDVIQPAPAPRFSKTPGAIQGPPPGAGQGGIETARRWGVELEV